MQGIWRLKRLLSFAIGNSFICLLLYTLDYVKGNEFTRVEYTLTHIHTPVVELL